MTDPRGEANSEARNLADYYQNLAFEIGEPLDDADRLRNDCIVLSRALLAVSATPEVESTKVSELKRQLAAEREHGRLLQAQVDAFARPAPERSGVGVVEALDIMNGLQPATQRSEPVAWRYLRKGTDSETLIFQSPDKVTRPQDYDITPLYAAPFSETPAGGTAKVPEGWKLVPLKLYEDTRLVMIQCEAGDWSFEEGWGRLLSSCPPPPGHAAAPSPDGNEEKGK
jgi:hypothetical protein